MTIVAQCEGVESIEHLAGPFAACNDRDAMHESMCSVFARLGNTPFELAELTFINKANGFVPVSRLNQLRRNLLNILQKNLQAAPEGPYREASAPTIPQAAA